MLKGLIGSPPLILGTSDEQVAERLDEIIDRFSRLRRKETFFRPEDMENILKL